MRRMRKSDFRINFSDLPMFIVSYIFFYIFFCISSYIFSWTFSYIFSYIFSCIFLTSSISLTPPLLSRCNRCENRYWNRYDNRCGDCCEKKCRESSYIDSSGSDVRDKIVFLTELLSLFFSKRLDFRRQIFANFFSNYSLLNFCVRSYTISRFMILILSQCSFSRAILFFFRWSTLIRLLLMILSIILFANAVSHTFSNFSESVEF